MDIGLLVKKIRISSGLTQVQIARRLKFSKSYISRVENNVVPLSMNNLLVILKELGVESIFISMRKFEKIRMIIRVPEKDEKFEFNIKPEKK